MIRIVVGALSPIKIEAVKAAAAELGLEAEVVGIETSSGVPPQPIGADALKGAFIRARSARAFVAADWAIGIENGLESENVLVDVAYVVVLPPHAVGAFVRSEAVPVPQELLDAVVAAKQRVTAGELEARRSGSDPADPHRVWSGGKTDRKTLLAAAIREALLAAIRTRGETP